MTVAAITAEAPKQQEFPLARVRGELLTRLPEDLYIPPDALEVFLEAFEGPLDLLLWLIRRQNFDILDIPVAEVAAQYMAYVELLRGLRLELAADYLVMAAVLTEIKSRMLLPRPAGVEEEDDPRAALVRRLQDYARFRDASETLAALPQFGRDLLPLSVALPAQELPPAQAQVTLAELVAALTEILARGALNAHHQVRREALSVRERMTAILERLTVGEFTSLPTLLLPAEGRAGVVVSFLAILELLREQLIELAQHEAFGPIYLRPAA
ncbi:ScpA family protein [Immundisolibacter sp.]|uniref:segregation and condensation protein A n=1 Tax=Immundisolibacter sp. TaxID=1934948 RepID=UPI00356AB7ED